MSIRSELAAKIEAVESKIGAVETRLDSKIDSVESRLESKIDSVESRLESKINVVDSKIDVLKSEMRSGFTDLGAALENALLRGELSTNPRNRRPPYPR